MRLLVAIEREFRVEFPREALNRETVRSIETILAALDGALPAPAPPKTCASRPERARRPAPAASACVNPRRKADMTGLQARIGDAAS